MSGSIIPTPLAIPTTRRRAVADVDTDATLGTCPSSSSPAPRPRPPWPPDATAWRRHRQGSARADTAARSRPSRRSAHPTASSRAATPRRRRPLRRPQHRPGPVATLAFFDTTTIACARPSCRCSRLIVTLGPTNRLRVNIPAAATGPSVAAITRRSSVLSLTPTLATWQPNPAGRVVMRRGRPGSARRLRARRARPGRRGPAPPGPAARRGRAVGGARSPRASAPPLRAWRDQPPVSTASITRRSSTDGCRSTEACPHEAVHPARHAARRQLQALGEVAHPHRVVRRLGQEHEHLVVAHASGGARRGRPPTRPSDRRPSR